MCLSSAILERNVYIHRLNNILILTDVKISINSQDRIERLVNSYENMLYEYFF